MLTSNIALFINRLEKNPEKVKGMQLLYINYENWYLGVFEYAEFDFEYCKAEKRPEMCQKGF